MQTHTLAAALEWNAYRAQRIVIIEQEHWEVSQVVRDPGATPFEVEQARTRGRTLASVARSTHHGYWLA